MIRTPLLIAALAFIAACTPPPEGPVVTFSPCEALVVVPAADTSPAQLQSVKDAVAAWDALGPFQLTLTDSPGAAQVPLRFEDGSEPFHGVYEPAGDVIINSKVTDPLEATIVITHELGHAMGLVHIPTDQRPSVMNPDNTTVQVTAEDGATLLAQWRGCPSTP